MGLVARLDALPVASLESYIASARASLGNNALAATWRPRIEFGVLHAEQALVKAQAAAAQVEAEPAIAAAPAAPKPRKRAAAAAAVASEAVDDEE